MNQAIDKRPYFFIYGDTQDKSIEHHGDFRTFDDAKVKADALLASGHILVHIRRAEWPREGWPETDIVVWAASSPAVDWRR
ncbi:MAG: hypothetical protein ACRYGG_20785 [Janthinobacterium lividum]